MQKAIKWLDAKGIQYTFHNYKELGIGAATLERWLQHFATDKLINTKSTTYKALPESEKDCIASKEKAIATMLANNSIIKRPVWDLGNGAMYLGWNEAELNALIK